MNIEKKIDFWKTRLLDLGKKNKLINAPAPKAAKRASRTSLVIESPTSKELWDILCKKEQSIRFPIKLDIETIETEEITRRPADETRIFQNGYQTNQPVPEACKTLLSLKNKSRVYMENKGMNALYMVFGFINWKEQAIDGQKMRSPLVLLPISISQDNILSPIVIQKTDDDPIGNNALQQRLLKDFDIEFPDFGTADDLTSYLQKVSQLCRSKKLDWSIEPDAVQIMMVSYLKMAVYHDMDIHTAEIKENAAINALNGSVSVWNNHLVIKSKTIDHDMTDQKTIYSVLDADSSQQDAIELAKSGVSFVLQGPPGTGKSQTITNIIAELIGQGKKVLFVSEKMAALEVVYKRLAAANLGDFCLTLHDPDAKRKEIIDQLAISVNLAGSKVRTDGNSNKTIDMLELTKMELSDYVIQIHSQVEPLGETIYHVNGYLSELETIPDINYVPEQPDKVSSLTFTRNIKVLSDLSAIVSKSGYQKNNPWNGCKITELTYSFRQKFLSETEELPDYIYYGFEMIQEINSLIFDGEPVIDIKFANRLETIINTSLKTPGVTYEWIALEPSKLIKNINDLKQAIKNKNQLSENVERIKSAWNTLSASLSEIQNSIKSDSDDLTEKQIADLKKSCDAYFMALSDKKESSAEKQKNDISTLVVSVSNIQKKLQQAENSQRELQKKQSEFTEITDKLNNLLTSLYPLINESVNNFTVNITPLTEYQKAELNDVFAAYSEIVPSIKLKQVKKDIDSLIVSIPDNTQKLSQAVSSRQELRKSSEELAAEANKKTRALVEAKEDLNSAMALITLNYIDSILELNIAETEKQFSSEYHLIWDDLNHKYLQSETSASFDKNNSLVTFSDMELKKKYDELIAIWNKQSDQLTSIRSDSTSANALVTEQYSESILDLDVSELISRFSSDYHSFWRFANAQYKNDLKMIREYSKTNKSISYKQSLVLFSQIEDAQKKRTLCEEQEQVLQNITLQVKECLCIGLLNMIADYQNKKKIADEKKELAEDAENRLNQCRDELSSVTSLVNSLQTELPKQKSSLKNMIDSLRNDTANNLKKFRNELSSGNVKINKLKSELSKQKSSLHKNIDSFTNDCNQLLAKNETLLKDSKNRYRKLCVALSDDLQIDITENSDFKTIEAHLNWVSQFKKEINGLTVFDEFVKAVCEKDEGILSLLQEKAEALKEWNKEFSKETKCFFDLFEKKITDALYAMPLITIYRHIKKCRENMDMLESYIDYKNTCRLLTEYGLKDYLFTISNNEIAAEDIVPAYKKCFYRAWLDNVVKTKQEICNFRHDKHEKLIDKFRRLDISSLQIARDNLKAKLISNLPNLEFSGHGDEAAILKRELSKKGRFMPIRKLIASIPMLLPSLKPCMMMSPLSVSTYFGASDYRFDTVIFDEASQVRTEEAICSIYRAKQVIIAGDSNQLPPTDFFTTSLSDSDEYMDDDMEDLGAYESLLDEASVLPTKTLLWHYRSRHEHLIAFSNEKIYKNNLITFPSAVSKEKDLGVEYIYVKNAIYVRGGKGGNAQEAKRIAELLLEHFKTHPERSVGIIAFGERQQNAIENEIIKLRQAHPEIEKYFKESIDEPVFIRNLETVQGDERDTIIFSIGYGFDSNGKFNMSFGPLSREGGERRLNVAITRARYNLKLVGSILPYDIKTDRISSVGPKLLREYIEFAMKGNHEPEANKNNHEALFPGQHFEKNIFNYLVSQGYQVVSNVGCSGYRIDMAVIDPNHEGKYILGIECDGEMYASARTVRERDRLRQTILESIGWNIYHVWSPDWVKDPVNEKARLIKAIRHAADNLRTKRPALSDYPVQSESRLSIIKKTDEEIETELAKKYRSDFYGYEPMEIPVTDFQSIIIKILSDGYGSRLKDNLIRDVGRLGYGWSRMGPIRKKRILAALDHLEKHHTIEIIDDEIRIKK